MECIRYHIRMLLADTDPTLYILLHHPYLGLSVHTDILIIKSRGSISIILQLII